MADLKQSMRAALASSDSIARAQVRAWIDQADDVESEGLLYELSDTAWARIEPRLEFEETCALIQRYLFRCIRENPQDGTSLSRYEAAWQLEAWIDHLASLDIVARDLTSVVAAVTDLYLDSDPEIRLAIQHGCLEHVLEQPALRPLFAHWAEDARLRPAWREALDWGEAHPDFMKGLRRQLRGARSDGD